ncbi:hypothetical protein BJ878DRAFT_516524 [Calycina marina]|uniref:Uncharacterized protein n=1 Tax=Calycina marina TaxID=1763456 RepID=A0A9P7YYT5_9HELO|nr:hypothetical protein BJ878DRAFT_516524 [Calycina marina]
MAACIFCWRRRKQIEKGWQAKRLVAPELHDDQGHETAYGARISVQPIPPAMRENNRSYHVVTTREIFEDYEAAESSVCLQRDHDGQEYTQEGLIGQSYDAPVAVPSSAYQQKHIRGIPGTETAPGSINRKEVPNRNSVSGVRSSRILSRPPLIHANSSQNQIPDEGCSSSRVSGALRSPVPDIYAYAGVTIEDDEELERLEEEERRIDEAIRESESRMQMRETEDLRKIRARLEGLRDSM